MAEANTFHQPFPFMRLPIELRLRVYELALDDLIATVTTLRPEKDTRSFEDQFDFASNPHRSAVKYYKRGGSGGLLNIFEVRYRGPPLLGPLAFLHTCSQVRAESIDTMLRRVGTHHLGAVKARSVATQALRRDKREQRARAMKESLKEKCTAANHEWKIRRVKTTLKEAARFRKVQLKKSL